MSDLIAAMIITPLAGGDTSAIIFHHAPKCWVPNMQAVGEDAHRVGDDGSVAQTFGTLGATVPIACSTSLTSFADAIDFMATIEALQWTVVRVQDAWGRTLPRVRIKGATAAPTRSRGPTVGGVPTIIRVDCLLNMERLTDS